MRSTFLTIVFYLVTLTVAHGTAQGLGLEVRPAGKELFETRPREIVTAAFRVTNTTSQQYEFISEVKLPEGWVLITEDFPFDLGANETTTKLVSFFVPEATSAGRYKITYLVGARKYPALSDFYTVDVVVLPYSKLEVKLLETPRYIIAGEYYQACFLVTNKSNMENTVSISIDSSENIPFIVDAEMFKLAPWQSKTVTVKVGTDAKIAKILKHRLRLTAQVVEDSKSKTQDKAESTVEIVPRANEAEECLEAAPPQTQPQQEIALKRNVEDGNKPSPEGRPSPNFRFILGLKDAKELLETEPRQVVTAVFRVTNPTDKKREFITEVKLPQGWVPITKDFPFELNPNETNTKLVSFFVPQTILAGKYKITYVIKDRKYPAVRDFYTVDVVVLPYSKLEVKLLESPMYVIAGEEYRSSFVVTNLSNTEYTINIKISSGENIPCVIDAEKFTLLPRQSKTVTVTVRPDAKIAIALKHRLQLTAEAVEDSKTKAKAQSESIVDIIPRISGVEDNFHRIPTEITFRYVSQKNGDRTSGFQTEVHGEGTLDEGGKEHLKFRFRGPDVQDESILGQRDEYSLSYWTKDYELHFGDRSYSLSWLTENYLYGRGLEGKLNINDDFGLGAYHTKTRWLEPGTEETAAYMDYLINEKYKIGLNYLRKYRNGKVNNITSFEGELELFENTKAELEYALGPGGSSEDNAYLTKLYGRNNWLSYYLKLTHAGPDYPGYYRDLDSISGGLTAPVNRHLRLNASFRREKNNLDLDPSFYSAPLEKYYQLGVDYRMETDTTFTLDWLSRDRKDRLDSPNFDYQEDNFRFGVGQGLDKLILYTSAERGKTKNNLDNTTSPSERYTASVHFRPNDRQSYGGYLYYDKNSDFTGENRRSTTIGLNANYKIANKTFFNLVLQTDDYQGSANGDRDNLEIRLNHTFANNNELSVIARHTRYKNSYTEDDTSLMVECTIPLGLPVCRKKSVGRVEGHVYDEETRNPVADCLLRLNGSTAVTDKAGNFTFPSVRPGIYYLTVDTASIGMDRIPSRKMPLELAVQGGEKTLAYIPVTRAAQLSGRVIVYSYKDNHNKIAPSEQPITINIEPYYAAGISDSNSADTKLIEDHGLANAIVELKSGSEIKRTDTNNQGCFVFEELRPDKWTLKIYSDNLPEYHYLEKDTFELELKPGQREEISAKVLPRKRRIHIITESQTLLEEKQ